MEDNESISMALSDSETVGGGFNAVMGVFERDGFRLADLKSLKSPQTAMCFGKIWSPNIRLQLVQTLDIGFTYACNMRILVLIFRQKFSILHW